DEQGALDGGMLALHARDGRGADRIADGVVSRFAGLGRGPAEAPIRSPDLLDGRPLAMGRLGASVLVGWGDGALAASLAAADDPSRSAGPALRQCWRDPAPGRLGAA